MESVIHLDTNVVVWLYSGYLDQLSDTAKETIELNQITVSPMVVLELNYLNEIGRLRESASIVMNDLHDRIGLNIDPTSFALVVDVAAQMKWTRDPFDRLITAQAAVYKNILLTKDETIRKNYFNALW
jgi:PIN domain nuclease of toxin-antitoxin system